MVEHEKSHIIVLGAGFGGLTFCQHFHNPAARVTLVDRTNHHLFQPLLYQVATAGLSAPEIAQPIRSILARRSDVTVLMDQVEDLDLTSRTVFLKGAREVGRAVPSAPRASEDVQNTAVGSPSNGALGTARPTLTRADGSRDTPENSSLSFDYLVLALGGYTSYFGHPEWEEFAPGLKTLDDALRIRSRVLLAFEKAENTADPTEREALLTIVIVGGGPTGVELAGAFAELARTVLKRDFRRIDPTHARIILVEAAPVVLGHLPPDLSESARRQLQRLGVQVRNSTQVSAIRRGEVTFASGETIRAENILWAAGVSAVPLTRQLGVDLDRSGRVKVNPDLSLPGHPEVFAIGDMAVVLEPNGQPVPGVSPAAMQMARHVALIIGDELDLGPGRAPRPPFKYWDRGTMATIGRSAAVAWIGRLRFSGFFAWMTWLFVHLIFLIGFRNKLAVLLQWAYSYFAYKRGARIIVGPPPEPPTGHA